MVVGGLEPYPPAPLDVLGFKRMERLPEEWDAELPLENPQLDCSECEYAELGEGRSMSRPLLAEFPLEYDDNGVNAVFDDGGGSSAGVSG